MENVNESLAIAWEKFDHGDYAGAESIYLQCYDQISKTNNQILAAALMGLVYVEAFLKKFDEARKYGCILLNEAQNEEEKHIAIHQLAMVERMAGKYIKAMELLVEEERLLFDYFPSDPQRMSANLYEQGYVALNTSDYAQAEKMMRMSLECGIHAADDMCIGCAYRGLGEIMCATGQIEAAKDYFDKAVNSFNKAGDLIAAEELSSAILELEYDST